MPNDTVVATWKTYFTERELQEIEFSRLYQRDFSHGTDGHNSKIIIAKMVAILESNFITELPPSDYIKQ